jgi:hypothetical protein
VGQAHADQLGVIRLGARGARLRFDPERARQAFNVQAPTLRSPAPRRTRRQTAGSILKVRG